MWMKNFHTFSIKNADKEFPHFFPIKKWGWRMQILPYPVIFQKIVKLSKVSKMLECQTWSGEKQGWVNSSFITHGTLLKTSYSIFRAGSSNKFEITALLSQPKIITNAIANQALQKGSNFKLVWRSCSKIEKDIFTISTGHWNLFSLL